MKWIRQLISTREDINNAKVLVLENIPRITAAAFDTETTGLHPVADVPFLFQCGFYRAYDMTGYIFVVELDTNTTIAREWIKFWQRQVPKFKHYVGHHIVFDLHMMTNIGLPLNYWDNLEDTQAYIRAASDAIQVEKGGEPLALKDWACRHIDIHANADEKDLKSERTKQAQAYNKTLLKSTGLKVKDFDKLFGDKCFDVSDLPDNIKDKYQEWRSSLPDYLQRITNRGGLVASDDIRYDKIDRNKVLNYSFKDIELTLTCWHMCREVTINRDNLLQVELESKYLRPVYEMERVGFLVDRQYLEDSRVRLKAYILQRRNDLCILAGEQISCSQNARIQQWLAEHGIEVPDTGAETLELTAKKLPDSDVKEFITTVCELRTLQKWYSTYIIKFLRQLDISDRIYTSINQVGAVSGRVSCDFQQFPKAGLFDNQGNELFDPRRMVITDEEYPYIIYLDYSAQELRVTATYTYLIGSPDKNLLRAYCPWDCHDSTGHTFDCEDPADRARSYSEPWFLNEDNTQWKKTDLHGLMTHTIFPELSEDDPQWHDLRYVGKRCNFLKAYGGSYDCIRQSFPDFTDELCHRIDEAYYQTHPGVKAYHECCKRWARLSYMDNLYGVKYYGVNAHHLRNTLIQGTCAYMTKDRHEAALKFMQEHHMKSKIVLAIHDELQWYWHKDDDPALMFELQKVMQDIDSQCPIISDLEVTKTNWKEKVEIGNEEELQVYLRS